MELIRGAADMPVSRSKTSAAAVVILSARPLRGLPVRPFADWARTRRARACSLLHLVQLTQMGARPVEPHRVEGGLAHLADMEAEIADLLHQLQQLAFSLFRVTGLRRSNASSSRSSYFREPEAIRVETRDTEHFRICSSLGTRHYRDNFPLTGSALRICSSRSYRGSCRSAVNARPRAAKPRSPAAARQCPAAARPITRSRTAARPDTHNGRKRRGCRVGRGRSSVRQRRR